LLSVDWIKDADTAGTMLFQVVGDGKIASATGTAFSNFLYQVRKSPYPVNFKISDVVLVDVETACVAGISRLHVT
jgi:hypothetical protein